MRARQRRPRGALSEGFNSLFSLAALSGSTASSAECEACGEERAGSAHKSRVKPASMKQEVSFGPV